MQDLNDLYFFAEVVEKGSFTSAAKALEMTTSRISRRIAELEERLGVRLLHRTTRKLALTDVGDLYYQRCRAMVAEAEAAQQVIDQVQAQPRGRIRVTCPVLFDQGPMGAMVTDFMNRYPSVQVVLVATDRKVDLVEEGFDLAVRVMTRTPEDSTLVSRRVATSCTWLVASPEYLARYGVPQTPEELRGMRSLGKKREGGAYAWQLSHPRLGEVQVPYQPVLESDDWMFLKRAAVDGVGVLAIPDQFAQTELAAGKLVRLLPDWSLPSGNIYIVYPTRRGLVPAIHLFIEGAAKALSDAVL